MNWNVPTILTVSLEFLTVYNHFYFPSTVCCIRVFCRQIFCNPYFPHLPSPWNFVQYYNCFHNIFSYIWFFFHSTRMVLSHFSTVFEWSSLMLFFHHKKLKKKNISAEYSTLFGLYNVPTNYFPLKCLFNTYFLPYFCSMVFVYIFYPFTLT